MTESEKYEIYGRCAHCCAALSRNMRVKHKWRVGYCFECTITRPRFRMPPIPPHELFGDGRLITFDARDQQGPL